MHEMFLSGKQKMWKSYGLRIFFGAEWTGSRPIAGAKKCPITGINELMARYGAKIPRSLVRERHGGWPRRAKERRRACRRTWQRFEA